MQLGTCLRAGSSERGAIVIFGFGKRREEKDEEDEDEEVEYVLFQGAVNGNNPDLGAHAKLVEKALLPVKELVSEGLAVRADMIRFEPKGNVGITTTYIDGVPCPPNKVSPQQTLAMVQMLKLLAGMDPKAKGQPDAGGIKASFQEKKYELRINSQPMEGGGERLTLRVIDPTVKMETPKDLGFPESLVQKIREVSSARIGLVLSAGPPYSGVTSVKLAAVRSTDAYLYSIYCLADLGGRDLAHVKMFETLEGDDLTKTMMRAKREDADVLVVDPIDSPETATAVLEFADKAAIVSEMTARDAVDSVVRLVQMTKNPELVADRLKIVISQMLIRSLCKKCRRAYKPNPKLLGKIGLPPETRVLYRPTIWEEPAEGSKDEPEACEECQGIGYRGRLGLLEVVEMTEGIQNIVKSGGDAKAIRAQVRAEKMQSFQSEGLRAVVEGKTSLEELQRAFKAT